MSPAILAAIEAANAKRREHDEAVRNAEEALTQHFEAELAELAKRWPTRVIRADSGMGSLSVGVERAGQREQVWIWGAKVNDLADHGERWEKLLDAFAIALDVNYVNFTRDIVVTGERYAA